MLLCVTLFSFSVWSAQAPQTLDWMDLIPQKERHQFDQKGMPAVSHNGNTPAQQNHIGSVRPELDGKFVKIPGFVIPLEGDDQTITEFLLVPYFGACIHVPPPPPNQIIYVKFPQGAPVQELWDVIYVVGKLKAEPVSSDVADAGYKIEGSRIEPYDDQ
ncbi:DUF3299 domain-containing protein [Vibrio mangrovi]|nr:DUF3299 domain-containing protein [Vibrio mangrovi]MDW6002823.1 DUF3299 domain-containing protein [Vibrio mangrovi]